MDAESKLLLREKGARADLLANQEGISGQELYANPQVTFFASDRSFLLPDSTLRNDLTLTSNARFGKTIAFDLPSSITQPIQQILLQIPVPALSARYTQSIPDAMRDVIDQIASPSIRTRLRAGLSRNSADLAMMEQILQAEQANHLAKSTALDRLVQNLIDQAGDRAPQTIISSDQLIRSALDQLIPDLGRLPSVPFGGSWRSKLISDSITLGILSSLATSIPIGFLDAASGVSIATLPRRQFLEQLMPIAFLRQIEQIVDQQLGSIAQAIGEISDRYPKSYQSAILLPDHAIYQYRSARPFRQLNLLYLQHFHHLNKLPIDAIETYYRSNLSRDGRIILHALLMVIQINTEMVVTQISSEMNQIQGDLRMPLIDPNDGVYWLTRHIPPMEHVYQMIDRGIDQYQIDYLASILQEDLPMIRPDELDQVRSIIRGVYDTLQLIWRNGSGQLDSIPEQPLFRDLLGKIPIDVMCASYQLDYRVVRAHEQIYRNLASLAGTDLSSLLSPEYQVDPPSIFRYQGLPYAQTPYRSDTGVRIDSPLDHDRSVRLNTYYLPEVADDPDWIAPAPAQDPIASPTNPDLAWVTISHLALVGSDLQSWATLPTNRGLSALVRNLVAWIRDDLREGPNLSLLLLDGSIMRDLKPDLSRLLEWTELFLATNQGDDRLQPDDGLISQLINRLGKYHEQYRYAIEFWDILSSWQGIDSTDQSTIQLAQEAIGIQGSHPNSSLWEREWLRSVSHSQIATPSLDLAKYRRIVKVASKLTGPAAFLWQIVLAQRSEITPADLQHQLLTQLAIIARLRDLVTKHRQKATIMAILRYGTQQFRDPDQMREYLLSRIADTKLIAIVSAIRDDTLLYAIRSLFRPIALSTELEDNDWPIVALDGGYLTDLNYLARIQESIAAIPRLTSLELDQIRIQLSKIANRPSTPRLAWVDRLGYYLIQSIQLVQNDQVISELTSQSLDYYHRVGDSTRFEQLGLVDRLLGNRDTLHLFQPGSKPPAILVVPILLAGGENGTPIPIAINPQDRYQIRIKLRDRGTLAYTDDHAELDPIELTTLSAIVITSSDRPAQDLLATTQYRVPAGKSAQVLLPRVSRSVGIASQLAIHLNPDRPSDPASDYLPKEIQWNNYGTRSRWDLSRVNQEHLSKWIEMTSYQSMPLVHVALDRLLADLSSRKYRDLLLDLSEMIDQDPTWPEPNYHWDRLQGREMIRSIAFDPESDRELELHRRSKIWLIWTSAQLDRWKGSLFSIWGASVNLSDRPALKRQSISSLAFRASLPRWRSTDQVSSDQRENWYDLIGEQILSIIREQTDPVSYPRYLIQPDQVSPIQKGALSDRSNPFLVPFELASAIYSGLQTKDHPTIARLINAGSARWQYQLVKGGRSEPSLVKNAAATMLYFWMK